MADIHALGIFYHKTDKFYTTFVSEVIHFGKVSSVAKPSQKVMFQISENILNNLTIIWGDIGNIFSGYPRFIWFHP